jgi:hypothetical protein
MEMNYDLAPYQEGWIAARDGLKSIDNPYPKLITKANNNHKLWDEGYNLGKQLFAQKHLYSVYSSISG